MAVKIFFFFIKYVYSYDCDRFYWVVESSVHVFFNKQSKVGKQAGACLWKKLVQAQSILALCLFIKMLLGVCLQKKLDQAHNALFYKEKM